MATFKELFWPHEYSPPISALKYHLKRCTEKGCYRKIVTEEPFQACKEHDASHGWLEILRAEYQADPLLRWELDSKNYDYIPPPHSIWWSISLLWRKGRR